MLIRHCRHEGCIGRRSSRILCCMHRGSNAIEIVSIGGLTSTVRTGSSLATKSIGRTVRTFMRRLHLSLARNSGIGVSKLNAFRVALDDRNARGRGSYAIHDVHQIGIHFITSGTLRLIGADRATAQDRGGMSFILTKGNRNRASNSSSKGNKGSGPNNNNIAPSPSIWECSSLVGRVRIEWSCEGRCSNTTLSKRRPRRTRDRNTKNGEIRQANREPVCFSSTTVKRNIRKLF